MGESATTFTAKSWPWRGQEINSCRRHYVIHPASIRIANVRWTTGARGVEPGSTSWLSLSGDHQADCSALLLVIRINEGILFVVQAYFADFRKFSLGIVKNIYIFWIYFFKHNYLSLIGDRPLIHAQSMSYEKHGENVHVLFIDHHKSIPIPSGFWGIYFFNWRSHSLLFTLESRRAIDLCLEWTPGLVGT